MDIRRELPKVPSAAEGRDRQTSFARGLSVKPLYSHVIGRHRQDSTQKGKQLSAWHERLRRAVVPR
jgi:hypothetical protein